MTSRTTDFEKDKQTAAILVSQGKIAEARQLCEQLCEQASDAAVLYLMGVISSHEGQYTQAAGYFRKALRIVPDYINAEFCLGDALRRINDYGGAHACFVKIIRQAPGDFNAYYHLGLTLESGSDYKGALHSYRKAQQLNPQCLDAVAGEASIYEKQAEPEKAYRILLPHMDSGGLNTRIAVQYGKAARNLGLHEEAIHKLEGHIDDRQLHKEDAVQAHFVLGMLNNDIGKYDAAFRHYSFANRLKGIEYDSGSFAKRVDGLIAKFPRATLGNAARAATVSERPVFVIGMPRSGTSLVEQILSSHPSVKGAGELTYLNTIARYLEEQADGIEVLGARVLNECADKYLAHIARFDDAARKVIDKMPANFLNLGYIELLFPGARVIHCRRDPIDTCLSCYFQNFSQALPETFDLESIGRYYLDYARMMRHWRDVITLPMLDIDYEHLVAEPQQQIRRLVEFTGVPWDDSCLEFYENRTITRTASYDQVRQPLYRHSVGRWRNYEKHIGVLTDLLRGPG